MERRTVNRFIYTCMYIFYVVKKNYTKIYLHSHVLKQKQINIVGDPKILNNN